MISPPCKGTDAQKAETVDDPTDKLMEAKLWACLLKGLQEDRASSALALRNQIRRAYEICQMAPASLRPFLRPRIDQASFRRVVDSGSLDTAAVALVGEPLTLSFEKCASDGLFRARVALEQRDIRGEALESSVAGAVLKAWCNCVIVLAHSRHV